MPSTPFDSQKSIDWLQNNRRTFLFLSFQRVNYHILDFQKKKVVAASLSWGSKSVFMEPKVLGHFKSYVLGFLNSEPSEEAYLFLHGFPANKGNKNKDLAAKLFSELKKDAFLIHYRGLGQSQGSFSFSHSIKESIETAKEILIYGKYQKINIYGHSWGSVVACNVANEVASQTRNLILACPLTKIVLDSPVLTSLVSETVKEMPGVFGIQTIEDVKKDLLKLTAGQPWDLAPRLNMRVSIIQALRDAYTPPLDTRLFLERFESRPHYIELDLDHSFMDNRPMFVEVVVKEFERMLR